MFKMKIEGLKELENKLDRMTRTIKSLEGTRKVPLSELLHPEFMQEFTNFKTFDEMLEKSPFEVKTQEDFRSIPDKYWDKFIAENTQFKDWSSMLGKAGAKYLGNKIVNC